MLQVTQRPSLNLSSFIFNENFSMSNLFLVLGNTFIYLLKRIFVVERRREDNLIDRTEK